MSLSQPQTACSQKLNCLSTRSAGKKKKSLGAVTVREREREERKEEGSLGWPMALEPRDFD